MTTAIIDITNKEGSQNDHFYIYVHGDGGPDYLGQKVEDFSKGYEIVNGLPAGDLSLRKIANGMGDFAAQLLAYLKVYDNTIIKGYVYLVSKDYAENVDADYWYAIDLEEGQLTFIPPVK